jgi:D-glycero-D-manno-heptose 1,7-bisphosphate phosphatase
MPRYELEWDTTHFKVDWGVFLDRDGTLTEEVGYVNHPSRLRLLQGAAEAVRALNRAGVPAVLATNQAGLARGYFTEEVLRDTFARLVSLLGNLGAYLDAAYYCPHHPSSALEAYRLHCGCRKPKTGMLLQAQEDLGLDLARSYVIGDKYSDAAFGKAAGAHGILLLTGYGLGEHTYQRGSWPAEPDLVAPDLPAAVDWILRREGLTPKG